MILYVTTKYNVWMCSRAPHFFLSYFVLNWQYYFWHYWVQPIKHWHKFNSKYCVSKFVNRKSFEQIHNTFSFICTAIEMVLKRKNSSSYMQHFVLLLSFYIVIVISYLFWRLIFRRTFYRRNWILFPINNYV